MFWTKKKYNTERPVLISVTTTSSADIAFMTFWTIVPITFLNLRSGAVSVDVYGDEFSSGNPQINAVAVSSAGNFVGSATVNEVKNKVVLNTTNPLHIFNIEPWYTRNVYFRTSAAGTITLNIGVLT